MDNPKDFLAIFLLFEQDWRADAVLKCFEELEVIMVSSQFTLDALFSTLSLQSSFPQTRNFSVKASVANQPNQ